MSEEEREEFLRDEAEKKEAAKKAAEEYQKAVDNMEIPGESSDKDEVFSESGNSAYASTIRTKSSDVSEQRVDEVPDSDDGKRRKITKELTNAERSDSQASQQEDEIRRYERDMLNARNKPRPMRSDSRDRRPYDERGDYRDRREIRDYREESAYTRHGSPRWHRFERQLRPRSESRERSRETDWGLPRSNMRMPAYSAGKSSFEDILSGRSSNMQTPGGTLQTYSHGNESQTNVFITTGGDIKEIENVTADNILRLLSDIERKQQQARLPRDKYFSRLANNRLNEMIAKAKRYATNSSDFPSSFVDNHAAVLDYTQWKQMLVAVVRGMPTDKVGFTKVDHALQILRDDKVLSERIYPLSTNWDTNLTAALVDLPDKIHDWSGEDYENLIKLLVSFTKSNPLHAFTLNRSMKDEEKHYVSRLLGVPYFQDSRMHFGHHMKGLRVHLRMRISIVLRVVLIKMHPGSIRMDRGRR
jgi:hypothetical protein